MNYEKKYKETLEKAREISSGKDVDIEADTTICEYLFPELKESEDEKIRKELISFLQSYDTLLTQKFIVWLEKQVGRDVDCPQNHQDCSRPNGCIVLEDFNGGEGFYKLSLDYLNKKQVEEVEEMVRMWNNESKTSNDVIKNCIGMCLTDVCEQRFKDYNTSLKDCLAWLEKQGEQKETICEQKPINDIHKPTDIKFHEGDFIRHNKANLICKVISANSAYSYYVENIETSGGIELFNAEQNFHLWTIEDAKDGDVLAAKECYVIFKEIDGLNIKCHCTYHYMGFNPSFHINTLQNKTAFQPATKEQRDLLFAKMKENGYEWDADKKELKQFANR